MVMVSRILISFDWADTVEFKLDGVFAGVFSWMTYSSAEAPESRIDRSSDVESLIVALVYVGGLVGTAMLK